MGRWQSHRSQEGEMPSFPSGATSWVWGPVLGSQHQTDVGILERVQQRWMWCLWPCLNALCKSWSLWGRNKEPRKTFINSISFSEGSVWASPDEPKIKPLLWGWWNWNNARGCQDRLHSLYPWAYSKPTARVPRTLLWAERLGPDLQRSLPTSATLWSSHSFLTKPPCKHRQKLRTKQLLLFTVHSSLLWTVVEIG